MLETPDAPGKHRIHIEKTIKVHHGSPGLPPFRYLKKYHLLHQLSDSCILLWSNISTLRLVGWNFLTVHEMVRSNNKGD
jgi:hypothetical protein